MAEPAAGATAPSAVSDSPTATAPEQTQATPPVEEAPWKKAKHKVKVNGKEAEIPYDELVTGYQLRQASDARLQEAASLRKTLSEAWNSADPSAFFKSKNMNAEEWAEKLLLDKLRRDKMSPEERQFLESQEKTKAERDALEREKKQFDEQRKSAITAQVTQQLDTEITAAFTEAGIKPDAVLVDLMARRMEAAFNPDDPESQPMPAKVALKHTLDYLDQVVERKLGGLSADEARKRFPKKLLDDLRKQDVELVRSQSPMRQSQANGASKPSTPAKAVKRMSTEDLFKKMEESFN